MNSTERGSMKKSHVINYRRDAIWTLIAIVLILALMFATLIAFAPRQVGPVVGPPVAAAKKHNSCWNKTYRRKHKRCHGFHSSGGSAVVVRG